MAATPPTRATIFRSEQQVFDRGRIRLSESDAAVLFETLSLRVEALLDTRGELIDAGDLGADEYYNRKIRALRRAMGELERTAQEKHWESALEAIAYYKADET